MQRKQRNQYIDVWKAMACIFVVLIHSVFPGKTGIVLRALARFAVPLFFMVSGFYFYNKDFIDIPRKTFLRIKKLLLIIFISAIGYFLLEFAENIFIQGKDFVLKSYLTELFAWEKIIRFFITNTPLVYMPRWFLYALVYCYLFYAVIYKVKHKKLYFSAVILLLSNMIMEGLTILNISDFQMHIGDSDVILTVYNLFVFRAFPWFLFGMLFKEYSYWFEKININIYWISCIVGAVSTCVQVLALGDFTIHIGTLFIVFGLFGIAIKMQTAECNSILVHIGNKLSLYVFVFHGAVISAVALFEKLIFKNNVILWFQWMKPLCVIAVTLIGSQIIYWLSQKVKIKRM